MPQLTYTRHNHKTYKGGLGAGDVPRRIVRYEVKHATKFLTWYSCLIFTTNNILYILLFTYN